MKFNMSHLSLDEGTVSIVSEDKNAHIMLEINGAHPTLTFFDSEDRDFTFDLKSKKWETIWDGGMNYNQPAQWNENYWRVVAQLCTYVDSVKEQQFEV